MKNIKEQLLKAKEAHHQFKFCPSYYNHHLPEKCSIANHPDNFLKNKGNFWGFPYDHNLISSIPEYINASPMKFNTRCYIAAQGPRTNTLPAFWEMIIEEKCSLIISVTNEREEGKPIGFRFKFNRFWPDFGFKTYGKVKVMLHEEQLAHKWNDGREEKIRVRKFAVSRGTHETFVTHVHMENWPDNGVVLPESLVTLSKWADSVYTSGPIVVHCAAGVGRTGTFIAFHSLYHDLMQQLSQGQEPAIDVPNRIHEMRKLRWGAMVADLKQYELIIDALLLQIEMNTSPVKN